MPNALTSQGLTTSSQAELVAYYTGQFQAIYGSDINLQPDSPDGQMLNIFVQAVLDLQDLVTQVYNMFNPDNAIGVVLDQRVAINGIQRQAGTYTITNITIVTSTSVNLYGLDQSVQPVYTVADNAGNQWQLQTTQLGVNGTVIAAFQAALPGATLTTPNTITVPVTVVLGVSSINNPTTYTTLGLNEETDAALRIRRQQSVSIGSQGYLAGLLGALENISGVTSAFVYENVTASTDGNGVPGHSIWVIVAGNGAATAIANAIYQKRNAGCGMKGSQSFTITQLDGTSFTVLWDTVSPETLFIKFTASSLNGTTPPNIAAILAALPTTYVPGVYGQVNVNSLAAAVQAIDPNTLVTSAGFSTTAGGSYTSTLTPTARNVQFAVSSSDIIILPIIVNPTSDTVAPAATVQFSSLGGYGTITWSLPTNASGGSINSSSGLYTAGASAGTDVVRATDSLGNQTNVNVVVT